eukprot:CAMPEP_0116558274 /NCGR_PEP_ID=MMETSP0397-20121206/9721_1 /TAXON_ID=216820 /ORGANISM="Cyclophora tenuis, Strain ECT3854" /LENGTH=262 /DNA_ID=CAMNT_0004083857 /DNA_START=10 /DNA_END=798 /DNA_ORIENTATION=-
MSVEVVQRQSSNNTNNTARAANNNATSATASAPANNETTATAVEASEATASPQQPTPGQQEQPQSSWRQLWTVLWGTSSLTPEEEREALTQLVDMFPQYDREDLLRELRVRRSPDGVVQSILLGVFNGQPRGAPPPVAGAATRPEFIHTGETGEMGDPRNDTVDASGEDTRDEIEVDSDDEFDEIEPSQSTVVIGDAVTPPLQDEEEEEAAGEGEEEESHADAAIFSTVPSNGANQMRFIYYSEDESPERPTPRRLFHQRSR